MIEVEAIKAITRQVHVDHGELVGGEDDIIVVTTIKNRVIVLSKEEEEDVEKRAASWVLGRWGLTKERRGGESAGD